MTIDTPPHRASTISDLIFPKRFEFGFSSSCNQTEGAVREGGKGISIWDTFPRVPGAVIDGSDQSRAIDQYRRYPEDFALLRDFGVDTYRPSIAWSRVDPLGDGSWNEEGLAYYSKLIDELLAAGVAPWVTLYHWDMPQALQDRGGWESRETVDRFVAFALKVQERLGDRVRRWTTFEEPSCVALFGYGSGRHAPGISNPGAALRAAHHVLLAHGAATEALKAARPDHEVGIALIFTPVEAATTSAEDLDAAQRADLIINRFFLEPVLRDGYSPDAMSLFERYTDCSHLRPDDERIISTPIDYLGVNYYFREYARYDPDATERSTPNIGCEDVVMVKTGRPTTLYGWEIDHDGLYETLMRLHHSYPGIPLYVTEAGSSFPDTVERDGTIQDRQRIEYLAGQFAAARKALLCGADVRGFCVWTLVDTWEWAMGWTQRFGLVHVDHDTLVRRPKESARWFRELVGANRGAHT